jgi:hypothetical protein
VSAKDVQLLSTKAAALVGAAVCYVLLPGRMASDWRGGLSVIAGLGVMLVLALWLRLTAAELWWWPFRPPDERWRR